MTCKHCLSARKCRAADVDFSRLRSVYSKFSNKDFIMRYLCCCLLLCGTLSAAEETREDKVRADRRKVEAEGFWIYNDLPKAFEQAQQQDKPLMVVLRCIPCEECVKLDDELIDNDEELRPLLEQFVRARQVSTNGLDLDIFQYDTDQSFAVFFLNADGTIYGRFGTRSHRTEWVGDVSVRGLEQAMKKVLQLHEDFDTVKASLAGKKGEPLEVASPEKYPALKGKYTDALNYKGNVVQSCIHCHQIGDAQREWYLSQGKPIPEKIFYPHPHPRSVGLTLDPKTIATIQAVEPESPAAAAGLRAGDALETMNGQPLVSTADVQWVLHNVDPDGGSVSLQVRRADDTFQTSLNLEDGWRRESDISWRVTSWPYRRMVTGGMLLHEADEELRDELNIPDGKMALKVSHLGRYGKHATARRTGFQEDDVIVSYDGQTDLLTDSDLLYYAMKNRNVGEKVEIEFIRDGRRRSLKLPMQD